MTQTAQAPRQAQALDTSTHVIKCAGLTKVFKDFWLRNRVRAVDQINLDIQRGELFGLLGPNGSGKSTTIKMILGLLHPTAGRIAVFGKRPEDVATKKMIGYLPEESYLYRFLNARETLDYYGRLFFQNRLQRKRRVDMLLDMVGLEAVQRRPVGEYSKGMQRRIGLAQALINDPHLLILDEPTTGLDPIGTRQIKDLLLELKTRGKTILLCSHLLSDVEDVCDQVAIMYGGKVRQCGTVDELLVEQDKTTLHTEHLDPQTLEEVRAVLERHGKKIDVVDRPRQKLEALFLDIVHQAQAQGVRTSGAKAGGRIAEFLFEDQVSEPSERPAEQVLADLTQPADALPEENPVVPGDSGVSVETPGASSHVDQTVLDQLSEPTPECSTDPLQTPAPRADGPEKAAASDAPSSPDASLPPVAQGDQSVLDSLLDQDSD